jgi:hypothetical protein
MTRFTWWLMPALLAACGCAPALVQTAGSGALYALDHSLESLVQPDPGTHEAIPPTAQLPDERGPQRPDEEAPSEQTAEQFADPEGEEIADEPQDAEPTAVEPSPSDAGAEAAPHDEERQTAAPEEIEGRFVTPEDVAAPPANVEAPYKPERAETEFNRLGRRIGQISVDIRPDQGDLPPDPARTEFAQQGIEEPIEWQQPGDILCSYTPWTFCFRPLYFEEVNLERYGEHHGLLQPAISGTQFFATVAILPYKMKVRPPRSCVCSNGFSRCGDCPLPGYGKWYWRWDAAAVQAAAVTGFVYILP